MLRNSLLSWFEELNSRIKLKGPFASMHGTTERTWAQKFRQQYVALLKKNAILAWRKRRASAIRLLSPCIFMIMVWLIDKAVQSDSRSLSQQQVVREPENVPVKNIPRCEDDLFMKSGCIDFLYTARSLDDSVTNKEAQNIARRIVTKIQENNQPEIPEHKVQASNSRDELDEWFLENPETAMGAVHFFFSEGAKKIDFTLQTNSSIKFFKGVFQHPNFFFQLPLQMAVEREIVREHLLASSMDETAERLSWEVGYKEYPHPAFDTLSVVGATLAPFLFAANMFGFVSQISVMVVEKQTGLRQAMRTMGMLDSAYWLSWATWETGIIFVVSLLNIAFGALFQFRFFVDNSFMLVFLLLFMFQLAMSGFGMLISVFLRHVSSATVLGFVIFIVGWMMQATILFGIPYSSKYYDSLNYSLTVLFTLFPWDPFTKGMNDLGSATTVNEIEGLSWSERYSYCRNLDGNDECEIEKAESNRYISCECVMPLGDLYGYFLALYALYFLLAVYLENVMPNGLGVKNHLLYFLDPRYWGLGQRVRKPIKHMPLDVNPMFPPDEDVVQEKSKLQQLSIADHGVPNTGGDAVELFGLQKRFGKFWSVKGSWFAVEKNQLFCLLGPNGAGKTTTINCLTGVLPPSGGDALVYGESIVESGGMDRIRSFMGVCPQFDVLWNELTGTEHLEVFGHIKGVLPALVKDEAASLLSRVKLTPAARQRSGTYSGGMKRRLSVAIALLGDPRIVYLDEPTTGMDPISRRYVWDIIESAKADRAIILTTHSMEEADVLGDKISVMARGNMRAIGTSLRLKQKYGAGYEISVAVGSANSGHANSAQDLTELENSIAAVKKFFQVNLGLQPKDENRAYITYLVPRNQEDKLPGFLEKLESVQDKLQIRDVQLSLTTLEEVFLKIARDAEAEALKEVGITHIPLPLTNGDSIQIGIGQTEVFLHEWNVTYSIHWGQDDSGQIMITDIVPIGPVPPGAPEPDFSGLQ